MCVTDILRPEIEYKDDWLPPTEPDKEKIINDYNKSYGRFLFYLWGVWCTAYARRNLWTGILNFKEDYMYSDTDSIKARNMNKHLDYINRYNDWIVKKINKSLNYAKIDPERVRPKTIHGEVKQLGIWDFEGYYDRFKALRAKCYMTQKKGKISITVAGLNKKITVPYLLSHRKTDPFNLFNDNLHVPAEYTGKNTHYYIDDVTEGEMTDYLGNEYHYSDLSSISLQESEYKLRLTEDYIGYLKEIQTESWYIS